MMRVNLLFKLSDIVKLKSVLFTEIFCRFSINIFDAADILFTDFFKFRKTVISFKTLFGFLVNIQ